MARSWYGFILVLVCVLPVAERQPVVVAIATPHTLNVFTLLARSGHVLLAVLVTAMIIVDALFLEGDIYEMGTEKAGEDRGGKEGREKGRASCA